MRVQKNLLDEATKFANEAIALDDQCAEAHYVLGLVYDHQVMPKKALDEFHRASKLDEDNPVFPRAIGALAASMSNWTLCIAEYTKVVKMTGNSADALMELALAYSWAGKPKSAASTYDQVVAAEPTRLDAWLQLGIVCTRDLKEYKRASKALHEYVNRGGKDPRVPGWIAQLDAK